MIYPLTGIFIIIIVSFFIFPILASCMLNSYEHWINKIELTKTSFTSKKEIIHLNI